MTKQVVKIGVIAPLSGPAATYGQDAVNAYQDALDAFESDTYDVELIIEDGKCAGRDAASAAQKLVFVDQVDAILGGICSSETLSAGKIAQDNGVLMLSPTSSSPDISAMGDWIWRFWNDVHAAKVLAAHIDANYERVVIVVENTDYAVALATQLSDDVTIEIADTIKFNSDEKDFAVIARQIEGSMDDTTAIAFLPQSESVGIGFVKGLESAELYAEYRDQLIGAYLFSSEAFLSEVGELAEGLVEVQLGDTDGAPQIGADYLEQFADTHTIQSIPLMVLLDREGMEVLLDAVAAGNTTSEEIRSYLAAINESAPRDGYFAQYYFDANGDAIGLDYVMQQIASGETVILE